MKFKLFLNNIVGEYTIVQYKNNGSFNRTLYQPSIKQSYSLLIKEGFACEPDYYPSTIESEGRHTLLFEFSNIEEFEGKFIEYLV